MLSAAVSRRSKQGDAEQLVAVRPQVLSEAEHALGNLFQRIHHIVRITRDGLGSHADRLSGALTDLQELLELVFDYVTPVQLEIRPVTCGHVAESLAAHLRAEAGEVTITSCPTTEVLADPRVLSRCFQLLARSRADGLQRAATISVLARRDEALDRAEFSISTLGPAPTDANKEDDLAWQVAGHLIELQGGELTLSSAADAVGCRLTLPLAPSAS